MTQGPHEIITRAVLNDHRLYSMLLGAHSVRDLPVALTTHVRLTELPTVRDVGREEMVTWGGTV